MGDPDPSFPSTHWTRVRVLQRGDETEAREAMEAICREYWYPVYAFLRRTGRTPADAEDLTQMFFQRLIEDRALHSVREEFGRLRSYLLGVLKRLLSDQTRHHNAGKRGGTHEIVSFDLLLAEDQYRDEPMDLASPDRLFDRAWAIKVLSDATRKLHEAFVAGDNEEAFEQLKEFLPLGASASSYRDVASRPGIEERVVRLQVHRMRQRYRALVEAGVRETLNDPGGIPDELAHLMALVGRGG